MSGGPYDSAYYRDYYARNSEKVRKWRRAFYLRNRDRLLAKQKKKYAANRDEINKKQRAAYHRKMRDNPDAMRAAVRRRQGLPEATRPQPKRCEACGGKSSKGSICLDHCHKRNVFRGWLCDRCNRALGILRESIPAFKACIKYLRKHERRS